VTELFRNLLGLQDLYKGFHIRRWPFDDMKDPQHFLERMIRNSVSFVSRAHGTSKQSLKANELAEDFARLAGRV
jgi:hypothetical protein